MFRLIKLELINFQEFSGVQVPGEVPKRRDIRGARHPQFPDPARTRARASACKVHRQLDWL